MIQQLPAPSRTITVPASGSGRSHATMWTMNMARHVLDSRAQTPETLPHHAEHLVTFSLLRATVSAALRGQTPVQGALKGLTRRQLSRAPLSAPKCSHALRNFEDSQAQEIADLISRVKKVIDRELSPSPSDMLRELAGHKSPFERRLKQLFSPEVGLDLEIEDAFSGSDNPWASSHWAPMNGPSHWPQADAQLRRRYLVARLIVRELSPAQRAAVRALPRGSKPYTTSMYYMLRWVAHGRTLRDHHAPTTSGLI